MQTYCVSEKVDADTERQNGLIGLFEVLRHVSDCWREHTRREGRDEGHSTDKCEQCPFLGRGEVLRICEVILTIPAYYPAAQICLRE